MKLAYRIVTPALALAAVAAGFFLKLFTFVIGSADDQINNLVSAVSSLFSGVNTTYEYSAFEIVKMLGNGPVNPDATKTFPEVAAPIMSDIIAFAVLFSIMLLIMVAVAVLGALANSRKKRIAVIITCAVGLVVSLACIIVSNNAFTKIINGDVNLTELVSVISTSVLATIATVIVSVTSATLSAGFYTVFGVFILIIIWTIIANFIIKNPIQKSKSYKRKNVKRTVIKP
ncbi:MAG: hypothetical protein IKR49_08530 [Clostridia bacterium]|nr:hypothetical protein [Clostridia bacterium]